MSADILLAWRKEFPILEHTTYLISHSLASLAEVGHCQSHTDEVAFHGDQPRLTDLYSGLRGRQIELPRLMGFMETRRAEDDGRAAQRNGPPVRMVGQLFRRECNPLSRSCGSRWQGRDRLVLGRTGWQ